MMSKTPTGWARRKCPPSCSSPCCCLVAFWSITSFGWSVSTALADRAKHHFTTFFFQSWGMHPLILGLKLTPTDPGLKLVLAILDIRCGLEVARGPTFFQKLRKRYGTSIVVCRHSRGNGQMSVCMFLWNVQEHNKQKFSNTVKLELPNDWYPFKWWFLFVTDIIFGWLPHSFLLGFCRLQTLCAEVPNARCWVTTNIFQAVYVLLRYI